MTTVIRYEYVSVLAPSSWTKSGTTRVTVRTDLWTGEVYLCVGNGRLAAGKGQAWALWAALGQALSSHGTAPEWLPAPAVSATA